MISCNDKFIFTSCCGQLWLGHMVCGQTCDGLYRFAFYLVNFGIPFGSHPIKSAQARHTGVHILPTGIHGLCFGSYFSGPLPQHSLHHGPLSRVHFGESLVIRLYSEIDQIHLSSEAQCVSHHLPPVDCHSPCQGSGQSPGLIRDRALGLRWCSEGTLMLDTVYACNSSCYPFTVRVSS